jgi:NADH dehydrogenase (ubiquinone) Fe-S protein 3
MLIQNKLKLHQIIFIKNLKNLLPSILSYNYDKNTLNLVVDPKDLFFVLTFLNLHSTLQYKLLTSITGVDYPDRKKRFEVIYELLSVRYNSRIRVKTLVNEVTPVKSIHSIFPAATWWEREIWDLFGVFFDSNHEIKRILTDYGFDGHPLRKDFPLSGYVESRYNDKIKRIVSEPLEHAQHFRFFDFSSGWSGN